MAKESDDASPPARRARSKAFRSASRICSHQRRAHDGSSHILDSFIPPYESTVTAHLWRDGAVMLGKLNNDEFAMGSSNETAISDRWSIPWRRRGSNTQLVPGGSSGGSAAAVAARLCLGSTGDRHRRIDPSARGVHGHGRHQAHLWPLLALGHRRVRILTRSGGAVCP